MTESAIITPVTPGAPEPGAVKFNFATYGKQRMAEMGVVGPQSGAPDSGPAAPVGRQIVLPAAPAEQPSAPAPAQPESRIIPITPAAAPVGRDPDSGRFVAKPKAEAAPASPEAPASSPTAVETPKPEAPEPLVDVPGFNVKLPLSQAMAVQRQLYDEAKAHIQAERKMLEEQRAAQEAAAKAREEHAENIIRLHQANPSALAAILGAGNGPDEFSAVPPQQPVKPLPEQEIEARVAAALEKREREAQAKQAEAQRTQTIRQRFDAAVDEGYAVVIDESKYSPKMVRMIRAQIAADMAEDRAAGKLHPAAPVEIIRAQARQYAQNALDAVNEHFASLAGRAVEVAQSAPKPIDQGATMMPRSEAGNAFFQGPITREKINNRIWARVQELAQQRGVSIG